MDSSSLYKVVEIEGKGLGCVALKDIKIGTLIVKETPQCFANEELYSKELYAQYLASQLESFFAMSKENQAQFLKLSNSFGEPDSLSDNLKDCHEKINQFAEIYYPKILQMLEIDRKIDTKLFNDVLCIYKTNAFGVGVGIKSSRFNHSCCSNAEAFQGKNRIEIRAVSTIKAGAEITIHYNQKIDMKNFETRQEFLKNIGGFTCHCELCQEEKIDGDEKTYETFQKLEADVEKVKTSTELESLENVSKVYESRVKLISYFKQMYKLAKDKKAPRRFILKDLLLKSFQAAAEGFLTAKTFHDFDKMEFFKKECGKISMAGVQIAKIAYGNDSVTTKWWKEKNEDFEKWLKTSLEENNLKFFL